MLDKAREFAIIHHGDQKYGNKPYVYHLDLVATLLEPYGELAQIIGYLHDVVEDTDVTVQQIDQHFNRLIAEAVSVVTDQPGKNRKEKKQKTYAFMAQVDGELEIALVVKAADRLANVLACLEFNRTDKLKMYKKEQHHFQAAVYRPGLCDELWVKLSEALDE